MKSHVLVLWAIVLAVMLLLAGCSKPTQTIADQKPVAEAAPATPPAVQPAEAAPVPAQPPPKAKPAPAAKKPVDRSEPPQAVPVQPEVQKTAPPVAKSAPAAPAPVTQKLTLPSGTLIPVRMIDSVNSETDEVGQTFRASIDSDIVVDSQTVVPKGADARLTLNSVTSAGKIKGKSELALQLDRIVIGNKTYAVVTDVVERAGASEGKKTARDVAIGGAVGAAIGAIAGGKKGAAIGAGVGAGGGAAVAVATKGEQVVVASESKLEFRLEQPLVVELRPR